MTEGSRVRAIAYLESYRETERWLGASRYASEYFGERAEGDEIFLMAKLYEIKSFLAALPPCREKLFLNLHYIRGFSNEKCAELLGMSERTVYRVKKEAIRLVARRLEEEGDGQL